MELVEDDLVACVPMGRSRRVRPPRLAKILSVLKPLLWPTVPAAVFVSRV